jgi:catechol-2,3-dioxygenase
MPATPKFAHVVFQTSQPETMRDWYCQLLDAHVVYEDGGLAFITFDEEHHRIALIKSPVRLERKTPTVAAMPRLPRKRQVGQLVVLGLTQTR